MTEAEPTAGRGATTGIGPGLTFLFALAAGTAVANLYWSQPLLDFIAADLDASTHAAGWLVTLTQVGYAVGILLVVPLGDVRERRHLVPLMMILAAAALLACAAAPTMALLLVAVTALGLTTVSGQILAPLAGDLAETRHRGRVVGSVVSGILIGILLSRTLSGILAGRFGWRSVYLVAAVATLAFAGALYRAIPATGAKTSLPYPVLIASVFRAVAERRIVRWSLVLGALAFACFSMFWTALTFLLSGAPYHYSVTTIGLFGLVGLSGAVAAKRAGRLHDRGWSLPGTGVGGVLLLASFAVAFLGDRSVPAILVAVVLLDVAVQMIMILSQTRLFAALPDEQRSRANTAFVTGNFVGGAIGSAAASLVWAAAGWTGICVTGVVLAVLVLVGWAFGRRGALRLVT